MKTIFARLSIIIMACAIVACGESQPEQRSDAADSTNITEQDNNTATTNTAAPSQPVPTGIQHEAWVPADENDFVELEGGVKLYFIEKGDGPLPSGLNQIVKAHYHGMLEDGTVFQSSFDRGVPLEFPLGGVIKGWQTGLLSTPVGSKIKLVIPPSQGYGATPKPGIPPNSTLVFDVQLLELK
jgi:FKBP-type peptidyl-prolyl cis-trans isomerase